MYKLTISQNKLGVECDESSFPTTSVVFKIVRHRDKSRANTIGSTSIAASMFGA
jgi:hypothetical protein